MYPSSSTPSQFFVYDTATVNGAAMANAKTRLAEAFTCIGGCSSTYLKAGIRLGRFHPLQAFLRLSVLGEDRDGMGEHLGRLVLLPAILIQQTA